MYIIYYCYYYYIDSNPANFYYCIKQSMYVLSRLDVTANPIIFILSDNTYYNFGNNQQYNNLIQSINNNDITLCFLTINIENFILKCDDIIKSICLNTSSYVVTEAKSIPINIYRKYVTISKFTVNPKSQLYEVTTYAVNKNKRIYISQRVREGFDIISYIERLDDSVIQLRYNYDETIIVLYTISSTDQLNSQITVEISLLPCQYECIPIIYQSIIDPIKSFDTKVLNYHEIIRTSPYLFNELLDLYSFVYIFIIILYY